MFKKTLLFSAVAVLVAMMSVATASALLDEWNRPNPLMDYVPQELAIYDTRYDNLGELDCRACHGDSLADRHHYTEMVLRDRLCTPCHEICDISQPDCDTGVVVIRDCTASGCHSWDDVGQMDGSSVPPNGWHHNTDLSASENCVACHDRNVVAEITPFSGFQQYPPSVVTPTPFSCENCHWGRAVSDAQTGFDGTLATDHLAGHPSTFDHYNQWDQFIGYYEYNKDILHNLDTHHMGEKGNVWSECYKCHANDPNDPSYDPYEPELIRYCEICHDVTTLHTIYEHVGPTGTDGGPAVEGWEAVGFHAPGVDGDPPTDYRGNGIDGFGASSTKWFEANEMCFGCHGDQVPAYVGDSLAVPVLDSVSPAAACPTGIITLSGSNFGDIRTPGEDGVLLKGGLLTTWTEVGVAYYSWTDDTIEIEILAWDLQPGNYNIKVFNETGASPKKTITVYDCVSPQEIYVNSVLNPADPTSNAGVCTNTISLQNPSSSSAFGFGNSQDQTAKGIYGVVQVSASQGNYIVKNYLAWNPNEVKFKFKTFFEDLDGDFIQDGDEPDILMCSDLALGTYSVYIKYIFYLDDDTSTSYTEGDTMTQVESSNPVSFELENTPYINQLNPKTISKFRRLRILGINFGVTQTTGNVHVGTGNHYNLMVGDPLTAKGKIQSKVKLWSNTKVVVNFRVRDAWKGSKKWVWVVKDGMVSNKRRVVINP
ncbi:MAG: hypothetical protein JSV60_11925 [Desulfobacterales bacterium]|nr:MAG: hypothetical protein JSV60_11925 [Desulfobacterales bacterium]